MKLIHFLGVLLAASTLQAQTLGQALVTANPSPVKYIIGQQGANSRVWQTVTQVTNNQGNLTLQTNQAYVELATGLNHLVNGQWVASSEQIQISPDGSSAVATNGQHQVHFPGNIYSGQIKLVTPDGQTLQSQPIGLSYFDGTNSVLIAMVTNATGAILPSGNQVIYANAFAGLDADLLYTYTKAGFEQDVILREQPPQPAVLGLNSRSTRLQVLTEFFNAPQPSLNAMSVSTAAGNLEDDALSFGVMQMGRGKAFLLGTNSPSVGVNKRWFVVNGRQFLIEEVPIVSIAQAINTLPLFVSRANAEPKFIASKGLPLPSQRLLRAQPKTLFMAQARPPARGVVLDYQTINTSQTNYTFQGDTTYYISGQVYLYGTNTFEGGAVIKYTNVGGIFVNSPSQIEWLGSAYRPVIFTAKDDNSVGGNISGSTGTPTGPYVGYALDLCGGNATLSHLRILYAQNAIMLNGGANLTLVDAQILHCGDAIFSEYSAGTTIVKNALFANVQTVFDLGFLVYNDTISAQNATFANSGALINVGGSFYPNQFFASLTNCVIANVTTTAGGNYSGAYNGTYGLNWSPPGAINALQPPFQSKGAGSYYLASGCGFFNQGTTNIDSLLLTDLRNKTTYPPFVLTTSFTGNTILSPAVPRDTNGPPDLGYHYDPLDYCWCGLSAGTTLTLTNGVAVGIYGSCGLSVGNKLISQGTPNNHIQLVYYSLVQEQPTPWGANASGNLFSSLNQAQLRFTDLCLAAGQTWNFSPNMDGGGISLVDCQLQAALFNMVGMNWGGMAFTNNIFDRCNLNFADVASGYSLGFYNNLFFGGTLSLNFSNPNWNVYDNLFSSANFHIGNYAPNHGYNGYYNSAIPYDPNTGYTTPGNQSLATLDFQVGPLGPYYYPTTGTGLNLLRNVGSTTANALGLFHYTVTTNQVVEGDSTVSIGYHYVAVDKNGNPLDSNGDGIPDYLSDANGNGVDDPGETPWDIWIAQPPLSQQVEDGDTVTFSVVAFGGNLTYQWTSNNVILNGATGSSYTINSVLDNDAASYAVKVSSANNTITTPAAQLTTDSTSPLGPAQNGNLNLIPILSQRQNYTFKSGVTYYISSPLQLSGNTTLEGGAVLKFDPNSNSTLQVTGPLICNTEQYYPAILTSIDDDANGEYLSAISTGDPQPAENGIPYLDLSATSSNSVDNLRICFADKGITTPSGRLDAWDCQFYTNNIAIVASRGATVGLHNVLIANESGTAVGASASFNEIDAEQVTADVSSFWSGPSAPIRINLTNSIILGTLGSGSTVSSQNVAIDPSGTVFQALDYANYYLAGNTYRQAGTPNISPQLLMELTNKTTYPPVALPPLMQISGAMTLLPQVPRYTNGPPDLGYYYAALDYTVAYVTIKGGSITVEPGTVIAVANEYLLTYGWYSFQGFDIREGSSFVSHGTPNKPNIFTAEKLVQEVPETAFSQYQRELQFVDGIWFGSVTFVPDFEPNANNSPAPTLNFRFSEFYLPPDDYHIWAGWDESGGSFEMSLDSSIYLNLQDCKVHGGKINLGNPDWGDPSYPYAPGAVTWVNSSFENVSINLDPTFDEWGYGVSCDMQVQAYNNLFHSGLWFHLEPFVTSAGNWIFKNNLFDSVDFFQDAHQPLDYNYNGYWPLSASELSMDWYCSPFSYDFFYGLNLSNTNQLQITTTGDTTTDGGNEQVLTTAPPYQIGPLGNFYLPDTTLLYGAGSDTPANLGLYHYTTRLDQVKEGQDSGKVNANIGVHYIATISSNSAQPMDTDLDGIPDYVENWHGDGNYSAHTDTETDWQNRMTDGINPDASNSLYLDIDLSGDGLVGRVKQALGINPLDPSNPFTLTPAITGQEPDIVGFEVPIRYSSLANIGSLQLSVNGNPAKLDECDAANDGYCLLKWNTDYEPPGQHSLQVLFTLQTDGGGQPFVGTANGPIQPFNSGNVAQFYTTYAGFTTSGTILCATTPTCPNATYTIELYDPSTTPPTPITTIGPNSTSTGVIEENWNGKYAGGAAFTGNNVDAVYNITLQDPASATQVQHLSLWGILPTTLNEHFDVAYAYNPCVASLLGQDGMFWNQMLEVVDVLMMPSFGFDTYGSYFDHFDFSPEPNPGYLPNRQTALNLLDNINTDSAVDNFYFYGQGSEDIISDGNGTGGAYLWAYEVAGGLGNSTAAAGIFCKHPYRFVFIDSCASAADERWQNAFGISDPPPTLSTVTPPDVQAPRAFLGWVGWKTDLRGCQATAVLCNDYGTTLNAFYTLWMSGFTLDQCIRAASLNYKYNQSDPSSLHYPLPVSGNEQCILSDGTSTDRGSASTTQPGVGYSGTSWLKVVGYPGLTRDGYDPSIPPGEYIYTSSGSIKLP
jgi:hypothetical protein